MALLPAVAGVVLFVAVGAPAQVVEQAVVLAPPAVVEMRAAALLMSGQSGGDLFVSAEPFVGEAEEDGRIPVTLVLEVSVADLPSPPAEVEIFVYGVGPSLEVRDAVTLSLDGLEEHLERLDGERPTLRALARLRLDPGLQEMRVLVRSGERFGLRNVEIDLEDPDEKESKEPQDEVGDGDAGDGSADLGSRIAMGRSLVLVPREQSDLRRRAFPWPALARLAEPGLEATDEAARAEVLLPEDVVKQLEVILDGYLRAIARRTRSPEERAESDEAPADEYLAELEAQAAERLGPKSLRLLVDLETRAFRQLRRRVDDPRNLLALIRLHVDAAEVHRRHGRYRLGSLAIGTAVSQAEIWAEGSTDDEERLREATWVLVSLAGRFEERGPVSDAVTLYERVLSLDEDSVAALFGLAGVYARYGEAEQAAELYERLLEAEPGHSEASLRLAVMWQRTGDREAARRADLLLARLVESDAAGWIRSLALQQRIRHAMDHGLLESVRVMADQGLSLWPRHAPFRLSKAWYMEATGETDAARQLLFALDPSSTEDVEGGVEDGGRTRFHRQGNAEIGEIRRRLGELEEERREALAAAVDEVLEKRGAGR